MLTFRKPLPGDDANPTLKIKPIFKYPSELHFGELLSGQSGR